MHTRLRNASRQIIPILCLTGLTFAGPEWPETAGPSDAGALPASAQKPVGNGPLLRITGELSNQNAVAGPSDFQDMYLIRVTDPTAFLVDVCTADFNAQVWLFDFTERAQLANDDRSSASNRPLLRRVATDGTGFVLTTPGLYYLAISGFNSDPINLAGFMFDQPSMTEISGPDGSGATIPVAGWVAAAGKQGSYEMALSGISFVGCPGDFDNDDSVGFADLAILLSLWGPCPGCDADFSGDDIVSFTDLSTFLSLWGACPITP